MNYNIANLMLSLASAMATPAGCAVGTDLFVHQLPATLPLPGAGAVLRVWGGPVPNELSRVPAASIQCIVTAMDAAAGLDLAFRCYESLHEADEDARPRSAWSIPGKKLDTAGQLVADTVVSEWTIHGLALDAPPGAIGRDDAGRWEISFNFHLRFTAQLITP